MLNVARAVRPPAPGVLDAEWRPVGMPLRLRDHPRNVRAEAQQRARARRKIFQRVCSGLMGLSFLLLIGKLNCSARTSSRKNKRKKR